MREQSDRQPLTNEQRAWLWGAVIGATALTLIVMIIVAGVTAYGVLVTPEQTCAGWRDPPEFCRELAKRRPAAN